MRKIRWAVLGAGNIAHKFAGAVELLGDACEICAVASKSMERARNWAEKHGIEKYYDDYETMLVEEKPDCAYIAVLPNDHYRLTMMCIEHGVAVLCEKAMFQYGWEAEDVYKRAEEKQVFVMEALWSRFLPPIRKAKEWLESGKIGQPELVRCGIGFRAPSDGENRYFKKDLGGGAAKDITCYAFEITTYLLQQEIRDMKVSATWSDTGVDVNDHISIEFEYTMADLMTSFVTNMDEKLIIYGNNGSIIIPKPHYAWEAFLYDVKGELVEHFNDEETKNGFTYEVQEVMDRVLQGEIQSPVVPWKDTLACTKLFDTIASTQKDAVILHSI